MKFQTLHLLSLVSPLLAHPFSPLDSASEIEKRQSNGAPGGPSTSWVARTKSGNVPYGTPILSCTQKGVIALTFDDGPAQYTEALLDLLDSYGAKATFFISMFTTRKSPLEQN